MTPLPWFLLLLYMTDMISGYQRQSGNNNHNNVDQKPTHLPPLHYPHGHKWTEPYFDLTMPKNITSLVGKSAYLGCRVKHLGNKTVAWIRHRDLHILTVGTYTYTTDQRFQTSYHRDIDEWTLQIKWAQQRDAGVYECQISTQPVRSFSVNLNIVVPTATILGGPDLYVDRGSTINLTCVIKFSPEPPTHIFWYHQDKVLSEETSRGRLKFKTVKSEESKSILLIHDADLPDSGKYSCYPSNTEIASIRVHVLQGERPEAMQTNAAPSFALKGSPAANAINKLIIFIAILHILRLLIETQKGKTLTRTQQTAAPAPRTVQPPEMRLNEQQQANIFQLNSHFTEVEIMKIVSGIAAALCAATDSIAKANMGKNAAALQQSNKEPFQFNRIPHLAEYLFNKLIVINRNHVAIKPKSDTFFIIEANIAAVPMQRAASHLFTPRNSHSCITAPAMGIAMDGGHSRPKSVMETQLNQNSWEISQIIDDLPKQRVGFPNQR